MGKTYIDTVKYIVHADVEIDGLVEKPDVVGAIFGQTEGLLGDELDLRELQKSGRIGRIEVDLRGRAGNSTGRIVLPSSLDRVETSILAAALETVDRVGPCEAKIKVERIEDTRTLKRSHVVNRAKNILRTMIADVVPESKEISELVRDEVKVAEVTSYGADKLPAGPNITDAEHIIVVEGRADVLTMLKCDIKNVIALKGKNIPKTVIDLSREKTLTVFVDGDRGGDLIIKSMSELAEVDFVAKAPDGKEVEELTKKEVIKCLRRKMPMEQFMSRKFHSNGGRERERSERYERPRVARPRVEQPRVEQPRIEQPRVARVARPRVEQPRVARVARPRVEQPKCIEQPKEAASTRPLRPNAKFENTLREMHGTLKGVLFDGEHKVLKEVDVKDLAQAMMETGEVDTIIFDGIITQRLVDIANQRGVKHLVAMRQSRINNRGSVNITTS